MRLDISETAAESLQLQFTEICGAIGRARVLPETRTEIQILCSSARTSWAELSLKSKRIGLIINKEEFVLS